MIPVVICLLGLQLALQAGSVDASMLISSPFDNFRIECPQSSGAQRVSVRMVGSQGFRRQDIVFGLSCRAINELYPWWGIPQGIAELEREDCRYSRMFDPIVDTSGNYSCNSREYLAGISRISDTRVQLECCRMRTRDETNCIEKIFGKPFGNDPRTEIEYQGKLINAIRTENHSFKVRFCDLAPRAVGLIFEDVPPTTTTRSTTPRPTPAVTTPSLQEIVPEDVEPLLSDRSNSAAEGLLDSDTGATPARRVIKVSRPSSLVASDSGSGIWSTAQPTTITQIEVTSSSTTSEQPDEIAERKEEEPTLPKDSLPQDNSLTEAQKIAQKIIARVKSGEGIEGEKMAAQLVKEIESQNDPKTADELFKQSIATLNEYVDDKDLDGEPAVDVIDADSTVDLPKRLFTTTTTRPTRSNNSKLITNAPKHSRLLDGHIFALEFLAQLTSTTVAPSMAAMTKAVFSLEHAAADSSPNENANKAPIIVSSKIAKAFSTATVISGSPSVSDISSTMDIEGTAFSDAATTVRPLQILQTELSSPPQTKSAESDNEAQRATSTITPQAAIPPSDATPVESEQDLKEAFEQSPTEDDAKMIIMEGNEALMDESSTAIQDPNSKPHFAESTTMKGIVASSEQPKETTRSHSLPLESDAPTAEPNATTQTNPQLSAILKRTEGSFTSRPNEPITSPTPAVTQQSVANVQDVTLKSQTPTNLLFATNRPSLEEHFSKSTTRKEAVFSSEDFDKTTVLTTVTEDFTENAIEDSSSRVDTVSVMSTGTTQPTNPNISSSKAPTDLSPSANPTFFSVETKSNILATNDGIQPVVTTEFNSTTKHEELAPEDNLLRTVTHDSRTTTHLLLSTSPQNLSEWSLAPTSPTASLRDPKAEITTENTIEGASSRIDTVAVMSTGTTPPTILNVSSSTTPTDLLPLAKSTSETTLVIEDQSGKASLADKSSLASTVGRATENISNLTTKLPPGHWTLTRENIVAAATPTPITVEPSMEPPFMNTVGHSDVMGGHIEGNASSTAEREGVSDIGSTTLPDRSRKEHITVLNVKNEEHEENLENVSNMLQFAEQEGHSSMSPRIMSTNNENLALKIEISKPKQSETPMRRPDVSTLEQQNQDSTQKQVVFGTTNADAHSKVHEKGSVFETKTIESNIPELSVTNVDHKAEHKLQEPSMLPVVTNNDVNPQAGRIQDATAPELGGRPVISTEKAQNIENRPAPEVLSPSKIPQHIGPNTTQANFAHPASERLSTTTTSKQKQLDHVSANEELIDKKVMLPLSVMIMKVITNTVREKEEGRPVSPTVLSAIRHLWSYMHQNQNVSTQSSEQNFNETTDNDVFENNLSFPLPRRLMQALDKIFNDNVEKKITDAGDEIQKKAVISTVSTTLPVVQTLKKLEAAVSNVAVSSVTRNVTETTPMGSTHTSSVEEINEMNHTLSQTNDHSSFFPIVDNATEIPEVIHDVSNFTELLDAKEQPQPEDSTFIESIVQFAEIPNQQFTRNGSSHKTKTDQTQKFGSETGQNISISSSSENIVASNDTNNTKIEKKAEGRVEVVVAISNSISPKKDSLLRAATSSMSTQETTTVTTSSSTAVTQTPANTTEDIAASIFSSNETKETQTVNDIMRNISEPDETRNGEASTSIPTIGQDDSDKFDSFPTPKIPRIEFARRVAGLRTNATGSAVHPPQKKRQPLKTSSFSKQSKTTKKPRYPSSSSGAVVEHTRYVTPSFDGVRSFFRPLALSMNFLPQEFMRLSLADYKARIRALYLASTVKSTKRTTTRSPHRAHPELTDVDDNDVFLPQNLQTSQLHIQESPQFVLLKPLEQRRAPQKSTTDSKDPNKHSVDELLEEAPFDQFPTAPQRKETVIPRKFPSRPLRTVKTTTPRTYTTRQYHPRNSDKSPYVDEETSNSPFDYENLDRVRVTPSPRRPLPRQEEDEEEPTRRPSRPKAPVAVPQFAILSPFDVDFSRDIRRAPQKYRSAQNAASSQSLTQDMIFPSFDDENGIDSTKEYMEVDLPRLLKDGTKNHLPADGQPMKMPGLIVYDTLNPKNVPTFNKKKTHPPSIPPRSYTTGPPAAPSPPGVSMETLVSIRHIKPSTTLPTPKSTLTTSTSTTTSAPSTAVTEETTQTEYENGIGESEQQDAHVEYDLSAESTPPTYDPSKFYHTLPPKRQKHKENILTFCTKEVAIRDSNNLVIACGGEHDVWQPPRCPVGTDCFYATDSTYRICCAVSSG
ncbi:hypothetical protein QR680_002126 [Steinernema hermaphroditum]|uniref:ZP domain-containing protein n=1 Tax=Steinernema hermaphroditum TaxID=289476 RepID=A0AA39LHJ6_9BILA|nr:hypothetical protein QR680_002126 [Steinernema hermaphroditum]